MILPIRSHICAVSKNVIYKSIMDNGIIFSPVRIEERRKTDIRAGDTVRVWQRIQEGERKRLQAFEGLVIARKHGTEAGATFTVRRIASGVGVERVFPLYSPLIQKIELVRRSKVRRAKLYYIRDRAAREVRKKMKAMRQAEITLADESVAQDGGEAALEAGPHDAGEKKVIMPAEQHVDTDK